MAQFDRFLSSDRLREYHYTVINIILVIFSVFTRIPIMLSTIRETTKPRDIKETIADRSFI